MKVKQIATIINEVNAETIGESAIVNEDLTNIVDIGKQIMDSGDVDNYVKKLIDRIGRTIFVDRVYISQAPDIIRDSWEYGSILEKVRCTMPDATNNDTWDLVKGKSYDPFVFNPPEVSAKLYNSKTTFEVAISFTDIQIKSAFSSPTEINRFFAMISNRIEMMLTLSSDNMIMRTINNLMAEKIASNNNVINLLAKYNTAMGTTLKANVALTDKNFLRYAAKEIMMYEKYMSGASMLFNNDGYVTFTPKDRLMLVLLNEFAKSTEVYMSSDTYHNELVSLNGYSVVPYWQGGGTDDTFPFNTISSINVNTASGSTVNQSGIIGVMFDKDACAVCNNNRRVTSIYNPKNETTNYFHKYDCQYLNDTAENCIVFIIADIAET